MKKFFLAIALAFSLLTMQSCKNDTTRLLVDLTATAQGQVEFTWPGGGATINGDATVFECTDTTKVVPNDVKEYNLYEAVYANDAEVADAANYVANQINVKGVKGKYHLSIHGHIIYGPFLFRVDEDYPKDAPEPNVDDGVGDSTAN